MDLEITCQETLTLLQSEKSILLIDCREPEEYAIAHIEGAKLIPMQSVPDQLDQIRDGLKENNESTLIVHCHHGMRSAQVATWLRSNGFPQAQSMAGGIDAWAMEIEPSLNRY